MLQYELVTYRFNKIWPLNRPHFLMWGVLRSLCYYEEMNTSGNMS